MQNVFQRSGFALLFAALLSIPCYASTIYTLTLNGSQEVPPTTSTATGTADITLSGNLLDVMVTFSGLAAPTTASHIHCCAPMGTGAGIAVPLTSLPLGVTSGSFTQSFDLLTSSIYSAAFLSANGGTAAGAEAALLAGLNSSMAYINIHTTAHPGGEISGYDSLSASAVPEPSTFLLGASMLAGIIALKKSR